MFKSLIFLLFIYLLVFITCLLVVSRNEYPQNNRIIKKNKQKKNRNLSIIISCGIISTNNVFFERQMAIDSFFGINEYSALILTGRISVGNVCCTEQTTSNPKCYAVNNADNISRRLPEILLRTVRNRDVLLWKRMPHPQEYPPFVQRRSPRLLI